MAESVTTLGPEVRGAVLVAGSHAGLIAAWYAATAGVRAVVLNDAGVGRDGAGIAGLAYLDAIGTAAAAVGHETACIGDGADTLRAGLITHMNAQAIALGVTAGMRASEAVERFRGARAAHSPPPRISEGRFLLEAAVGAREIWALDSVGQVDGGDAGRVLVIGSHAALHGGRPESALQIAAAGAVFHDAGVGRAGVTRLPALDERGIPAVAVAGASARIGDARSLWETGTLSFANACARALGARPGLDVRTFARRAARR